MCAKAHWGINMKVVFVILNYNTYQETVECVLSIENMIDTEDYKIIIVDNKSKDDSAKKISEFIEKRTNLILVQNTENLGFARGNNVGIQYANCMFKPEFIVVLNSDTEIMQDDLITTLEEEYKRSGFALLGPLILTADGHCDNSPHYPPTIEHVQRELDTFMKEERIIRKGFYRLYCGAQFLRRLFKLKVLKRNTPVHRNMEFHQYQTQVVLQGCFVVFSARAFEYIDGFDDRTFLYYEEPILYLNLMKHGLITVYDPEIVIYHKDRRATGTVTSKNRDKLLFVNKCYQDSARILLDILKNEK